jgi:hypothetical protein
MWGKVAIMTVLTVRTSLTPIVHAAGVSLRRNTGQCVVAGVTTRSKRGRAFRETGVPLRLIFSALLLLFASMDCSSQKIEADDITSQQHIEIEREADGLSHAKAIVFGFRTDAKPFAYEEVQCLPCENTVPDDGDEGKALDDEEADECQDPTSSCPPGFMAKSYPRGYSVDICRMIRADLSDIFPDLEVRWLGVNSQNRFRYLDGNGGSGRSGDNRIDLLCGTATVSQSRLRKYRASLFTFLTGASYMCTTQSGVTDIKGMEGKAIGYLAGSTTEKVTIKLLQENKILAKVSLRQLDTYEKAEAAILRSMETTEIGEARTRCRTLFTIQTPESEYAYGPLEPEERGAPLPVDSSIRYVQRVRQSDTGGTTPSLSSWAYYLPGVVEFGTRNAQPLLSPWLHYGQQLCECETVKEEPVLSVRIRFRQGVPESCTCSLLDFTSAPTQAIAGESSGPPDPNGRCPLNGNTPGPFTVSMQQVVGLPGGDWMIATGCCPALPEPIACFFGDRDVLREIVKEHASELMLSPKYFSLEPYALMMRPGDSELAYYVDRTLARLFSASPNSRDSIHAIFKEHFGNVRMSSHLRAMFEVQRLPER